MKKIFLLLACVATLSACNTNTGGEVPLIIRYIQIGALFYLGTLNQLAYNLDPFDMAFRLNTLITETQNEGGSLDDLNSSALKTRLFGATTITKEGPVYTLNLATVAPDDIRSGTIRINTADGTLKDGHTWTLSLPKDEPYMVSIEGYLASVGAADYSITAEAENKWKVYLNGLVCKTKSESGTSGNTEGSNWSGNMTIVQVDNPGFLSLNGISTSFYTVEISNTTKVTTAYVLDAITVRTLTPLTYYSPKCKQMITNGSMSIHLAESEDLLDFAYAKWTPGTEDCKPTIALDYHGVDIPVSSGGDSSND